jgi:hypothetical protein
MVTEPILIIGFNRPAHLKVLIDRLREIAPTQIYVALDGSRPDREGEREKVAACRELIHNIDWPCTVKTNFQETNLGCGLGVSTAITWFFEQVDRGIILEDDIIPDPSFFPYCTELLDRYAVDPSVFAISGCNFVPAEFQSRPVESFRFSQVPHIWGWATWKDRWQLYSLEISGWRERLPVHKLWTKSGGNIPGTVYWAGTFELLARKEVDTWDGQLVYCSMVNNALTATSNVNLIQNIGFDGEATHTLEDRDELQPVRSMDFPLVFPTRVQVDSKADAWTRRNHFRATWRGMLDQGDRYLKRRKAASKGSS